MSGTLMRKLGRRLAMAAGLATCLQPFLCAQSSARHSKNAAHPWRSPAENYSARIWQTRDGLPQETVQAVGQTPDGFLWIGTTGGLLRFDGSHFLAYDRGSTPAFQENSVFSLMTASDGSLWIGTEGGGLLRMSGQQFQRFGAAEGLTDEFVRTELQDRQGRIWIGTDNGLFRLPTSSARRAERIDQTDSFPAMAVHALAMAQDGAIWIGGSALVSIRDGRHLSYPLVGEYSETRVKSILQTHDGTVWVGTVSGLQRMAPGTEHFERYPGVHGTVRSLHETPDGTLWIGTIGQGALTLHGVRLSAVGSGDWADLKLPSRTILSLFGDTGGNVWMGTQAGLVRFSRSPVKLTALPNASDSDFETVSTDSDGSIWVAGASLTHLLDKTAVPTTFPQLHGARVRNVFRAQDGALWIGTDGQGIFRIGPGKTVSHFTTANGLVNNFIRAFLPSRSGDLWIATDEGLSRWSHGAFHNLTMQDGLVYFSVRTMLEDPSGDLWIGTDHGLSFLSNGRFVQNDATRALRDEKVWALDQPVGGALWIGTPGNGLYRFDATENSLLHFTTEQGLASNSVYSILEDKKSRFWMSGANGVNVVSVVDLERLASDPHALVGQRFFSVSTGGELTPLYGGTMPAVTMTPNGDIWFPTSKGPVEFLNNQTNGVKGPIVFLDQIVADGRILSPQASALVLPASNRNVEFAYGAILLGPQDAVQFQYKLEGFDSEWRFGSNRRVADYTNLPARSYTFRVRAFQDDGGPLTERAQTIVKQQYFFFTWWFLGCCVLLLTFVAWWLHRQRLRRVELAFHAVLEERARLAREMHDTLIQGCTGVSLLLEAATAEAIAGQHDEVELLNYARTQLAAAIDEARQAVWNLRAQASIDLAETLQTLTERLDRSANVDVRYSVSGKAYGFHQAAIREIGMASREAIYNALLHANPTSIHVKATFGDEDFCLTVVDDGSGFEASHLAPDGHYGLMGIKERIRGIGGSVGVTSAAGRGTSIVIQVPRAAVSSGKAYASSHRSVQERVP